MQTEENSKKGGKFMTWLKRIGVAGFIFFTLKGIVWIFIFLWLGKCAVE